MLIANYLVAFYDLLGQTVKLQKFPVVPQKENQNTDFQKWAESTFYHVQEFRRSFNDFYHTMKGARSSFYNEKGLEIDDITMTTMSDSIIVYTPLLEKPNRIPPFDVFSIFTTSGLLFLYLLASKIPFRGAMEIGNGTELKDLGFYGSSILNAYCLETTKADYPRIVIGEYLMDYLKLNSNMKVKEDDKVALLMQGMSMRILNLIKIRADQIPMIDFLNPYFREIYRDRAIETFKKAFSFIQSEIDKYQKQQTDEEKKLYRRYILLKEYFDDSKTVWC